MKTTTDAGTRVRTSPGDDSPGPRLAELKDTLLGGRGPGASGEEVAEHTCNRAWLDAVPPPAERALLARQTEHLRAGEAIANGKELRREYSRSLRAAVLGAVAALLVRAFTVRRARPRGQPRA